MFTTRPGSQPAGVHSTSLNNLSAAQAGGRRQRGRAEPGGVRRRADLSGRGSPAASRHQRAHHHTGADPPDSLQYVLALMMFSLLSTFTHR